MSIVACEIALLYENVAGIHVVTIEKTLLVLQQWKIGDDTESREWSNTL